jgi:putative copper export protein
LSLKISIFIPMIVFAAVNRLSLKPRLSSGGDAAATTSRLRRNVIIEFVLGTMVILIVAVLGLLMPPMP